MFEVARQTTVGDVNGLLEAAAAGRLAGVLGYEPRPLVSVDFKDDAFGDRRRRLWVPAAFLVVAGLQSLRLPTEAVRGVRSRGLSHAA